jgi:hypothetical protein
LDDSDVGDSGLHHLMRKCGLFDCIRLSLLNGKGNGLNSLGDLHMAIFEGLYFLMVVMGQFIDMLDALDDVAFDEFLVLLPNSQH